MSTRTINDVDTAYAKTRAAQNAVLAAADFAEELELKAEAVQLNEALVVVTNALVRLGNRLDRARHNPGQEI